MSFLSTSSTLFRVSASAALLCAAAAGAPIYAQEAPSFSQPMPAPIERQDPARRAPEPEAQAPAQPAQPQLPPEAAPDAYTYDPTIFRTQIPADQLAFLPQFEGAPASTILHDKRYRKLLGNILPTGMFHYGSDRSISDSLDMVMERSTAPVQIIDNRYAVIAGSGAMMRGRGFIWIDMQEHIGLGVFSFYPSNGEPTPSVVVFSREIQHEDSVALGELPPAFAAYLHRWTQQFRLPAVTARYFITGSNKRILLEHDENYCDGLDGNPPEEVDCAQTTFDAADMDVTVADYLEETHHATNATAYMIGGDQTAWIHIRDSRCGLLLSCRIIETRRRTNVILHREPRPAPPPHRR